MKRNNSKTVKESAKQNLEMFSYSLLKDSEERERKRKLDEINYYICSKITNLGEIVK
jgi:hypothetical protein